MLPAIMETLFDAVYLILVITLGSIMLTKTKEHRLYRLFGLMAVVLGGGDAFHLVPRAYSLLTAGLEANATALGIGKFITSITMTVFYVILYHIWRKRYQIKNKKWLTTLIYGLAILRIALCLFPQNNWLTYNAPISWGIYRNIPFAIMGMIIIVLFYNEARRKNDNYFRYMWLAIVLSFAFYIPVVLFSNVLPIIGILMIPKTLAYVWIVFMGYQAFSDLS